MTTVLYIFCSMDSNSTKDSYKATALDDKSSTKQKIKAIEIDNNKLDKSCKNSVKSDKIIQNPCQRLESKTRREFIDSLITGFIAVGTACSIYPLLSSFNPAKDTLSSSTIEIDLSKIPPGITKTFSWQGKPIFIRHRTINEIKDANLANLSGMKDPEEDTKRTKPNNSKWLVVIGICTHLGCVPKSENYGWVCPCHGSKYDLSGRIISGPAPTNLAIPAYEFINENLIRIG